MHIEALPNGKFKFIEYYIDPYSEKRRRVSVTLDKNTPQTRNKAIKKLQEKLEQKQHQKPHQDITFEEVFKQFYQQWSLSVKAQSKLTYRSIDRRLLDMLPQGILMKNIDKQLIQKVINDLFTQGYAEVTLQKQASRYKQVADYAEEHGIIDLNPIKNIRIPKREKTVDEIKHLKNNYLSKYEVKQIADYFKSKHNHHVAIICQLLFLTGLRFGELIALTDKDIDPEKMTLHVTGTFNGYFKKKTTPKNTGSTRTIVISPNILKLIKDYQRLNKLSLPFTQLRQNTEGYIFLSKHGSPYILGRFNDYIKEAGQTLGLEQNITSHIFRHSHISLLTEMGMPLKQIMDRVGHVNSKTTLQIYTHVTTQMQNDLQTKLSQIEL